MKRLLYSLIIFVLMLQSVAIAKYKLTINFEGFTPHLDQLLYIRIVDKSPYLEVARERVQISSASFSVDLYALLPDSSYYLEYFADHNKNGEYDPPPADHAWRVDLGTVSGNDTTITITHNTNFSDIYFSLPLDIAALAGGWEGFWDNPTFSVDGKATGQVAVEGLTQTISVEGQAWGIMGNPDATNYTITGSIGVQPWTAEISLREPLDGTLHMDDGTISGAASAPDVNITAAVKGNYGIGQAIIYYDMSGGVTAEEYLVMQRDVEYPKQVSDNTPKQTPSGFKLQNYPNPFNPTTTISFSLDTPSHINLDIFDVTGRRVKVLLDESKPAGHHSVLWNGEADSGAKLASGLYLYRLQVQNDAGQTQQIVKKMSLLK